MKRSRMTFLILAVAFILTLGIFVSFYWSFVGISDGDVKITLPSDNEVPSPGGTKETPVEKIEITKENVRQIIKSMNRPESCFFQTEVKLYSQTDSASWKNTHYIKNGYTKTEQYNEAGTLIKNVITGNGMIYLWRPGGDARYYSGRIGDSTPDTVQMIPTYEDIVNRDQSEIQEARYEMLDGNNCIYVKAFDNTLKYTDEYYISLDSGILVRAVTRSGERLIYEMRTGAISVSEVSDKVFMLPNNKLAMEA